MYDPLTVVFTIRRPPVSHRERRGRRVPKDDRNPLYQSRAVGFINVRPRRFRCAYCDDGHVKADVPSYHACDGYLPGDPCPDCRGRGYRRVSPTQRLGLSWAFFRLGGREWYMAPLITVWHRDPERPVTHGRRDDSCRANLRRRQLDAHADERLFADWVLRFAYRHLHKAHVHHWRLQVPVWQNLNRTLWSRCAGCGGRFSWGYSPVSRSWYGTGPGWRRPERDIYHQECCPHVGQGAEVTGR